MADNNPIRYEDLVKPDNSIRNLIDQLNELIQVYNQAKGTIQQSAQQTTQSLQQISGATADQRKQIELTAQEVQSLADRYKATVTAEGEAARAKKEVNEALREQTKIAKDAKIAVEAEDGSYNKLAATYRLVKRELNAMSEADRKGTDSGRRLEQQAKAIYEQMNKLQMATGKATLQVGHYERSLGQALGVNTQFLTVMTDTSKASEMLNGVMSALKTPIGALIGVVGAATAAFKLYGESVKSTQTTGDALDYSLAGWTARWDLFKKAVATVDFGLFIRGAAEAAAAGTKLAQVLDEVFERTNSVNLQRAAMASQNAELMEIFRDQTKTMEERQKAAETYLSNVKPLYEQEIETNKRVADAQLERLFAVSNARQYANEEERDAAKQELANFIQTYNLNEDRIKQAREYNQAIKEREKLSNTVVSANAGVNINLNELDKAQKMNDEIIKKTPEAIKQIAGLVEQYGLTNDKEVKAYVDAQVAYLNSTAAYQNENRRVISQMHSLEKAAQSKSSVVVSSAKAETKAVEVSLEEKRRLEEAEAEKQKQEALKQQKDELQAAQQTIALKLAVVEKGTQEELQLRMEAIDAERDMEIFENSQKAEAVRQAEADINAKYDKKILDTNAKFYTEMTKRDLEALRNLEEAENDLIDGNERQKTIFRLNMEKQRLQDVLTLNETAAEKMTDMEIEAVKKQMDGIDKKIKRKGYKNIWEVLGFKMDEDQQAALDKALSSVKDLLDGVIDSWLQVAEAATAAADAQVDAAQKALDAEIEARNAGYANNVETMQKELAEAKKNRDKALKEEEKAKKAQIALDSVQQASSLITASANIWAAFGGVFPIGPALAAAAIVAMWASFAMSKAKALQATKSQSYGEGTVELLEGGSHASGHDIDMGTKKDGTRRRAEGGEYFAIINKRNSRRYRKEIPEIINALNDGTFADKYQRAGDRMSGMAIAMGGANLGRLEKDVSAIRRQGEEQRYIDGTGRTVIKYHNLTRRIYS